MQTEAIFGRKSLGKLVYLLVSISLFGILAGCDTRDDPADGDVDSEVVADGDGEMDGDVDGDAERDGEIEIDGDDELVTRIGSGIWLTSVGGTSSSTHYQMTFSLGNPVGLTITSSENYILTGAFRIEAANQDDTPEN